MTLKQVVLTVTLCSLTFASGVDGGTEAEIIKALEETQEEVAWKYIPLSGPSIDDANSKNVTAQVGKTAVLNCRIKYLGGKTVSWMRARDLHLLTVGRFTYTSDDRFRAVHQSGSDDWLLKIHYAQHRDAGAYECQVSTTPPLSRTVWLTVVEPETRVLGGPDLHINSGSTINLTCVVQHSPEPPPYIFWYHENELLSYDSPRGGITVVTEHGPTSTSRLLIQKATLSDAGRYTCRPANADPHFLTVHIIHNEHPAAIHHKNGTSSAAGVHQRASSSHSLSLMLLMLVLITACNVLPSENYKACQAVSRGGGGGGGSMPNVSGDKHRSSEGFGRRGLSSNGSRESPSPFDLRASSAFPGESREAGRRGRPFVAPLGRGGSDLRVRCCNGPANALGDGRRRRGNLACELGRLLHGLRRHGDSCHDSRRHPSSCEASCAPGEAPEGTRFRDRPPCPPRRLPDALIDHSIRSDVSSALAPSSRGPHDHIVPSAPCRPRGRPAEGALPPESARDVPPSPGKSGERACGCDAKKGTSPALVSAGGGAPALGGDGRREASVPSLA